MNKRTVLIPSLKAVAAIAAVVVLLAGCATTTVAPAVLSVTVTPASPTVHAAGTAKLTATVSVTGGAAKTVTWKSSNNAIATVASDGTVTGVAAGTVTITATSTVDTTKKDSASVTVDLVAPTVTNLTATNALGSMVDLSWTGAYATSYDIYTVLNGTTTTTLVQAGVTATTYSMQIPDSTHQTIEVVANGPGPSSSASVADVALTNVVVSSADYDPYSLQGFTPQTPIPGTLRDVLANAAPGAVIGFASDITSIDVMGVDTATTPHGTLDAHLIFNKNVTVTGPAAGVVLNGVTADPNAGDTAAQQFTWESRMALVLANTKVTLDHLTLQGGTFVYDGGGIRNEGDLTLSNSTVTGNRAWYEGGGIINVEGATLTLTDSHVDNNQALTLDSELGASFNIRQAGYIISVSDGGYGGGIYNRPTATITSTNTTFDSNEAKFSGGGIYAEGGDITMDGSAVSNNNASYLPYTHSSSAFSYGGGIFTAGTFSFSNADFTGNTSADLGGGFSLDSAGTATLDTVTFDGNTANYGGGIEHYYCTDPSNLTLTNVTYGTNTGLTGDPDINLYDTCAPVTLGAQSAHPSAAPPYTQSDLIKIP